MRKIERSTAFRRDYKRESKGKYREKLDNMLLPILNSLAADIPLQANLRDHLLSGNFSNCRECHIKPDLLLVYSKGSDDDLQLVRLGSHSEVFG